MTEAWREEPNWRCLSLPQMDRRKLGSTWFSTNVEEVSANGYGWNWVLKGEIREEAQVGSWDVRF